MFKAENMGGLIFIGESHNCSVITVIAATWHDYLRQINKNCCVGRKKVDLDLTIWEDKNGMFGKDKILILPGLSKHA